MNNLMNTFGTFLNTFLKDEEGAQVVEYALIIAVVSIALVLALGGANAPLAGGFAAFITRVTTCLTGTCV